MKVKHLLLALAIPSAFAACSQDEFVNEMQKQNDNRPVVGAISLDFSNENSRWDWSSALGFKFDDEDIMGACLMDKVEDLGEGSWTGKYTIVDYIGTNYKYGYKDGWTNNDAIMSEGNYFFYMPYNNELKSRAGLPYNIPTEQYAYDEKTPTVANATLAWKKNQMFIGYDDIKVGDKTAKTNLVEAFAKPRFNVNYTGSNGVVIERIVVTDGTGKFAVKGTLKPTGVLESAYNPVSGGETKYQTSSSTPNLAVCFQQYNKALAEYELKEDEAFVNPLYGNESKFFAVTEVDKATSLSLNFVPAKEVTGLMVVPAGEHTFSNVTFQIYTNKGLVEFTPTGDKLEKATEGTGITYSNMNTLQTIKAGDGKKENAVTINFADADVTQPEEVTVSTTSQLESIIRWYTTGEKEITITTTGDNVQLSKTVYDAIKGNDKLAVTFAGKLTIPADLPNDALDLLADEGTGTVIIKGTQNLVNTTTTAIGYGITIEQGAVLNVGSGSKTTTFSSPAKITNNGTLNVNTGTLSADVDNYAAFNITSGATVDGVIQNLAIATASVPIMYTPNALIINNGNLKLEENSTNQCKIENNSKLYIAGAATNDFKAKEDKGTNGYTGIIENKDASASYIYAQAAFTNKGTIDNTGALYSQGAGEITNSGYIKANDGSTTYVTSNQNGEIELGKRSTETTVNTEMGAITYTMTESDLSKGVFSFATATDKFNTLKVGMDVQFAKDKTPANLILTTKNLTVACPESAKFESITAEGSSRYIVQGVKVQTEALYVKDTAVFQIPALSTFGVYAEAGPTIEVSEGAEVLVGGKFYSNNSNSEPTSGTFSSAGTGSYNWNDTTKNFGVAVVP